MKPISNNSLSIGTFYPNATGRRKRVTGAPDSIATKVALLGDSTLDNGYWVEQNKAYIDKTHTVTHQTAVALAESADNPNSYDVANFAVDGATTNDLMDNCPLDKVLPTDDDHTDNDVHQLDAVAAWRPDVAVLSVGGNNYREALMGVLRKNVSLFQLLFRITPEQARPIIKEAFNEVKRTLLREYKTIIDKLIRGNPNLNRLVLLSQYYPSITDFTAYQIYAGFSHVARSAGKGQTVFQAVEETMNELYQGVLQHVATKNKEVVFVDVTSSMNPLGGYHTCQIEPNEQGSNIMGRLIAQAIEYKAPEDEADKKSVSVLSMDKNEEIQTKLLNDQDIQQFKVKKLEQFIQENRYRHVGLLFSPSSNLSSRYAHTFDLVMGKQFDSQYTGLFAFGLVDVSLVTLMASYLWRVAVNEQAHLSLRIAAGVVAAPIWLGKVIVGLALMLVLALPIYGYHHAVQGCNNKTNKEEQLVNEPLALAF